MSTFLAFAAVGELKISYLKFGPTEFRLALIIINALLVRYGTGQMITGLKYVNAGAVVGLCLMIYKIQKRIWRIDMARKEGQVANQTAAARPAGEAYIGTSTLCELDSA